MQTWCTHHPGWEYRFHTSTTGFKHQAQLDQLLRTRPQGEHLAYSAASDIMRFELLGSVGGVYVDVDTECLAPLPAHFMNAEAFACWENERAVPGWIASCVLGARAGSPLFQDISDAVPQVDLTQNPALVLGPGIVTKFANRHPELDVHPARSFCPHYYNGVLAPGDAPVYALHHWGGTVGLRRDADGRWLDHRPMSAAAPKPASQVVPPLVSVIIPCIAGQLQYLPEAVASVVAQTFADWEIVVAAADDEASEGASRILTDALEGPPPKWSTLVRDGGKGLGHARNVAIAAARGRFILSLDADDLLEPSFMAKALAAIEGHEYGIACSLVREFGDRGGVWNCAPWGGLLTQNALPSCALFQKALWEAVGGYDVTVGFEDWDLWVRCSELKPYVVQLPEYLFKYRVHGASLMHWNARNGADPFYRAMLRLRHPSLYPADQVYRDRLLLARMPAPLQERLEARRKAHPHNHSLRALSSLATGKQYGMNT